MGETFPHRPLCYICSGDPLGTSHHDYLLQCSQPTAPIHTNPLCTPRSPARHLNHCSSNPLAHLSNSLFFFVLYFGLSLPSQSLSTKLHRAYHPPPPPTSGQQSLHEMLNFSTLQNSNVPECPPPLHTAHQETWSQAWVSPI